MTEDLPVRQSVLLRSTSTGHICSSSADTVELGQLALPKSKNGDPTAAVLKAKLVSPLFNWSGSYVVVLYI
jgi:hypothetical protein